MEIMKNIKPFESFLNEWLDSPGSVDVPGQASEIRVNSRNYTPSNDNQLPQQNFSNVRYIPLTAENIGDYFLIAEGTRKLRHLFLFNDVLVCAKYKTGSRGEKFTFQLKWYIPLSEVSTYTFQRLIQTPFRG